MSANLVTFAHAASLRLKGPGGYYILGDVLGFVVGLGVAIDAANGGADLTTAVNAARDFIAGSPAAIAFSAATLIFFWSAQDYYQAWKNGYPPDAEKTRRGDLISGVGAVVLGAGLSMLGSPLLAASSGLLHAAGKFGNAFNVRRSFKLAGRTINASDLCRESVLLSRIPAFAITTMNVSHNAASLPLAEAAHQSILPATMLVCYGLWAAADIMLMSRDCAFRQSARYASRRADLALSFLRG